MNKSIDIDSKDIPENAYDNYIGEFNNSPSKFLDNQLSCDCLDDSINKDFMNNLYSTDFLSMPNLTENEDSEQKYIYDEKIMPLNEDEDKEQNNEDHNITFEINNNTFISLKKIKEEIIKNSEKLKNKIIKDEEIIKKIEQNIKLNNIIQKYECGRKKLGDKTERPHNKYSYDNVIKNIKGEFFNRLISFSNKVLDLYVDEDEKKILKKMIKNKNRRENENEDLLKMLKYQIINKIKKDYNLKLLQMTLKEFLSQDINSRFQSLKPESNKIIIDFLSKEGKNNKIINFILKLKVEDFLDFYTYKKEIAIIEKIQIEKDMKFERANDLLDEIAFKDDLYFSIFIFHLFNFKWWFNVKTGRKSSKRRKNSLLI